MNTASTMTIRYHHPRRLIAPIVAATCVSLIGASATALEDAGSVETDRDPMAHVLRLMGETGERLGEKLDPGPETQALQQRILERLDDAIDAALRQRSQNQPQPQSTTDEREMPEPPEESADESESADKSAAQTGVPGKPAADANASGKKQSGPLVETRRGWGNLPARDRDEILQGVEERVLDAYRDLAKRYYRTLAESAGEEGEDHE